MITLQKYNSVLVVGDFLVVALGPLYLTFSKKELILTLPTQAY
jgi:hypothetical protein